jgi:tRNA(fMet)-specific endonuclease VapC
MNGRYLLDTNIIIALFARDNHVVEQLGTKQELFIPSVVLGEWYYGARNSSRVAENVARIERLSSVGTILGIDAGTASRHGEIKHALKQQGTPIPENDIWIAALAMQYDLILATQDKHFDNIAQLTREAW